MPHLTRVTILGVLLIVVSLGLLTTAVVLAAAGDITTVAGTGSLVFGCDEGPATSVVVGRAEGLAFDSSGNLFIADTSHQCVRRVDAVTKIMTTVAGDGFIGFNGDGTTSSRLNNPHDVAVDSVGNLFIADESNDRIRRVDAVTKIITTVAGTGVFGFSGDDGPATSAQLNGPDGIAVDSSGNLFIADSFNNRIRRVDAVTQIITTFAGNGEFRTSGDGGSATSAEIKRPIDLAVDSSDNIFFVSRSSHRVRRVDGVTNIITTVAGTTQGFLGDGGRATIAKLADPHGIAVDPAGNIFITDHSNQRIRMVDTSGIITTVAGTGSKGFSGDGSPATSAELNFPVGVAVDSAGNLFISDRDNGRIREVEAIAAGNNADLAVAKSGSPDPVVATGILTYTVTVTNSGPLEATGVTLTDPLPSGVGFYLGDSQPGLSLHRDGSYRHMRTRHHCQRRQRHGNHHRETGQPRDPQQHRQRLQRRRRSRQHQQQRHLHDDCGFAGKRTIHDPLGAGGDGGGVRGTGHVRGGIQVPPQAEGWQTAIVGSGGRFWARANQIL